MNILLLGCGKLGKEVAIKLHRQGHCITCISRSKKELPEDIIHLCQDIHHLDLNTCPVFDKVYVIISPQESSLSAYYHTYLQSIKSIYQALSHQLDRLQHIIYISSTRIYHQNNGEIIDDDTLIMPYNHADPLAKVLISSELLYQAYFGEKAIIIRPSGLYSGDSKRLMSLAKNLTKIDECHYMNLIHRQDVADFLVYLNSINNPMSSYILTAKSYVRGDFLNTLRQKQGLPAITMADNLPITGKRMIAKRLSESGFELSHLMI